MASPIRPDVGRSLLGRLILAVAIIVGALVMFSSCTARVDAGHVGILVKLAGSSRGVEDIPLATGWVFYNPLTEQLIMFPTSVQNVVWTKDPHEGNPHDESITFSSQEAPTSTPTSGSRSPSSPRWRRTSTSSFARTT